MKELLNFSWLVEGKLAGSARPGCLDSLIEEDLRFVRKIGIKGIISLTEEPLPQKVLGRHFAYLHLPVKVMAAPTLQQVREGLDFIEGQNRKNRPVLVHCTFGRGRTGALLACYLVRQGYVPLEAIDQVRYQRPGSIESPQQAELVFEFALSDNLSG